MYMWKYFYYFIYCTLLYFDWIAFFIYFSRYFFGHLLCYWKFLSFGLFFFSFFSELCLPFVFLLKIFFRVYMTQGETRKEKSDIYFLFFLSLYNVDNSFTNYLAFMYTCLLINNLLTLLYCRWSSFNRTKKHWKLVLQ